MSSYSIDLSPCSSSCSTPEIHPASFVHPSAHSPALIQMLELPISEPVIQYLVDCVADTVDFALRSPNRRQPRSIRHQRHPKFTEFAATVLKRSETTMPVLLTSLVYIQRAKAHLQIGHNEWALERVFLGALILASKYLNDSTLKNVHWSTCTGVFGKRDVGRVEREFLDVLDFELQVSEAELLVHHPRLCSLTRARSVSPPARNVRARHHRHLYNRAMPVLEPSSPSSDEAESPRTPETPDVVELGCAKGAAVYPIPRRPRVLV